MDQRGIVERNAKRALEIDLLRSKRDLLMDQRGSVELVRGAQGEEALEVSLSVQV
jgi:hypothetical protein